MSVNKVTNRIEYLAKSFDIFDNQSENDFDEKIESLTSDGFNTTPIVDIDTGIILAILSIKDLGNMKSIKKISISSDVFSNIIIADPTPNKINIQWLLNLFSRLVKMNNDNSIDLAIRFVTEDLPQANIYLTLFEGNKRKHKFINLCKGNLSLSDLEDYVDINQYNSLPQLFSAVYPFLERDISVLEKKLEGFVNSGQAIIPVKDHNYTLYIPKTTDASTVFNGFTNWCTAIAGNTMFNRYTENNLKPNGDKSDIYIIINNNFFTGESEEIYQIHFETGQIKTKQNTSNVEIVDTVLKKSEGIKNYFYNNLIIMAKEFGGEFDKNKYITQLLNFGFSEVIFDLIELDAPAIIYKKIRLEHLPSLTRFKSISSLVLIDCDIKTIDESIGELIDLDILVLFNNKIKELPKEIGLLKNLTYLGIGGNKNIIIPSEIKYLDPSNGGKLFKIVVKEKDIGVSNYKKLRELLPQVEF